VTWGYKCSYLGHMSNSGHGRAIKVDCMHLPHPLFDKIAAALQDDDPAKRNEALMALGMAAPLGWSMPDLDEEGVQDEHLAKVDAQQPQR
jgi:hypothetical protein